MTVRVFAFVAGCAPLFAFVAATAQPSQTLRTESTTIHSYDGRSMPAENVRITVPERRAHPGRTISVAGIRITTAAAHPGNPIVFLMGGPGIPGSVMAPIPPYFALFERLHEQADVVIIDQRGIGKSEPNLDCPNEGKPPDDFFLAPGAFTGYLRQQVAQCAAHWRQQGADPTAYSTVESADDLDDLRAALGYAKVDILGFSYGTDLALVYLERHEEHVGRMVLQGVNGPGTNIKSPLAVARKLTQMDALLAKDAAWKAPIDLETAARKARERLAATPAKITITDRKAGTPVETTVGRQGLDEIVALNLNDTRLPALLVSVAAGDDRVLTQFAGALWNAMNSGTAQLMGRSVDCTSQRPASRMAKAKRESETAPFGMPVDNEVLTANFCRAVGVDKPRVEFAHPVRSAVPALLLTGTLDATCPVENAQEVARGLSNAEVLSIENAQHEALTEDAVQDVVVDFIRGTDVRGRKLVADSPRYLSVEDAAKPRPQHGGG
jgi:pimeloyl-ACP methyl ester carboxylesterase